ncbi:MAG TPA: hypothetical protein VGD24_09680 [Gallionella sp.]
MKYLIIFCLLYGGYSLYDNREIPPPPEDPNVIMYSLTTCRHCKIMAKELAKQEIAHVEYFMDKDQQRLAEYHETIRNSGLPNPYVTPIFVIYGEVLPNNPSIESIKATIAKYR